MSFHRLSTPWMLAGALGFTHSARSLIADFPVQIHLQNTASGPVNILMSCDNFSDAILNHSRVWVADASSAGCVCESYISQPYLSCIDLLARCIPHLRLGEYCGLSHNKQSTPSGPCAMEILTTSSTSGICVYLIDYNILYICIYFRTSDSLTFTN